MIVVKNPWTVSNSIENKNNVIQIVSQISKPEENHKCERKEIQTGFPKIT